MKFDYDWQYNVLNIYNTNRAGGLERYYDFIKANHQKIDGDICEVGVYQGRSLLATALLLKSLGSDKKVYGFDSFSGFPSYHKRYDSLNHFDTMFKDGVITLDHLKQVKLNSKYRELFTSKNNESSVISSSGDFSDTSVEQLKQKIEFLKLDNIEIIEGSYANTMTKKDSKYNFKFFSVLMDCDLYDSYKIALPFIWERMETGAYMFLDEYFSLKFPGARVAIDEFFNEDNKPIPYKTNTDWSKSGRDFERWYARKWEQL